MRVPARVFADDALWDQIRGDRTVEQLLNVTTLPGVIAPVFAMPDAHEGYGFPVGGVAAFGERDGIISPGGVGYDINCGVRLLATGMAAEALRPQVPKLMHELSRRVASGTGRGGRLSLEPAELDRVLAEGSRALLSRGLAAEDDLDHTEASGSLQSAEPDAVSPRAKQRGRDQLGSLGSGNHFVEVQVIGEVFDSEAAAAMGLAVGDAAVLIHTGSRGLGHQVCTDYVRQMDAVMRKYGIRLPDRELACAPFDSPEGTRYFGAMCAAANYAFANRQVITQRVREAFGQVLGKRVELRLVYDVAHNMAKLEQHGRERLIVHRKGATRAFGPSHPETPTRYRAVGQPVLIPGSMGTASYALVGTDAALERSFGSCCHGAGRAMSRRAAKRFKPGHEVRQALEDQGVVVTGAGNQELAEEAPHAYKDVDRVVDVVHAAGLARRVARLAPIGVLKG
ncbi:MAG: RtcB family protein [Gemmatimonadota bacterium]|nr:RtcB family protein [Gemmatimonadota bacterium]